MGRNKSITTPQGNFYLKPTPNKQGEMPVYLQYYVNGKYAKRSTGVRVKPKDWDKKHQSVISSDPLTVRKNLKLQSLKKKVDDQILSIGEGTITFKMIQQMLDGEFSNTKPKDVLFIDYCNDYNEKHYGSKYGYSVYYNSEKSIKQFEKYLEKTNQSNLTLGQINLSIITEYRAERLKKLKRVSVNKVLAPLIKAIKFAKNSGHLSPLIAQPIIEDGYLDLKEKKYTRDTNNDKDVHYLTLKQLQSFIGYKPTSNSAKRTEEFKQFFLFSLYSCGMRISDIATLEWAHIDFKEKTINKRQVKTREWPKIKPIISNKGIEILEEWKKKKLNKTFVFNLLPPDFNIDDEKELRKAINRADRTINQSLNHIGKQIELPFKLTIHVARHTFCVYALSKGLSLHFVSQIMGHASILATEKTYAHYLKSTVEHETEKLEELYKTDEAVALYATASQ